MASHGGILGIALGTLLFAYRRHRNFWVLGDQIAAIAPLGIALGRIANFINGELWGRPGDVPWAVIFPDAPRIGGQMVARHPSQLYAAFLEGFLLLILLLPINARHRKPGLTGACFLVFYGIGRFVGEFWREPDVGQPIYFGWMSKGQAFTIPVLAAGLVLLVITLRQKPKPEAYEPPAEGKAGK